MQLNRPRATKQMKLLLRSQTLGVWFSIVSLLVACSSAPQPKVEEKSSMGELVFLTRQGCVNTVTMRNNLDDALKALGLPTEYQFIDADTLAPSDRRGGYGTPTVLYEGRDLFGMSEPPIPHPPPT
jgi:hypothetical protein